MDVLVNNNLTRRKGGVSMLKKAGFTMIELLVVLGIFAAIMAVALFNQAGLNSSILLTNLAYETALAVREAQTYGIGVRASGSSGTDFDKGYGVYFDVSNLSKIVIFKDTDGDNFYDESGGELQSVYQVQNTRGNKIASINFGNSPVLSTGWVSIMFKRPNPEASFYTYSTPSLPSSSTPGPINIIVSSADGTNCRSVIVEVTGQIRVASPTTPGQCVPTPTPIP